MIILMLLLAEKIIKGVDKNDIGCITWGCTRILRMFRFWDMNKTNIQSQVFLTTLFMDNNATKLPFCWSTVHADSGLVGS